MKKIVTLFGVLAFVTFLKGQPYKVGDTIPSFKTLLGLRTEQKHLADGNKKLILLDFWSIWCGSCIKSFPEMEALQKKFNDNIQIILVTKNTSSDIRRLYNKLEHNTNIRFPNLPLLSSDSLLSSFFPYTTVPHHVWIDSSGKVNAITSGWNTTAKNIENFLATGDMKVSIKNDILNFSPNKPLLIDSNGGTLNSFLYHSILTKSIDGLGSGGQGSEDYRESVSSRILLTNLSRLQLYSATVPFPLNLQRRILVSSKDKINFDYPQEKSEFDEWISQNIFCYDLIIPIKDSAIRYEIMREDLDRYLGYKSKIEKRKVKSIVISNKGNKNKYRSDSKEGASDLYGMSKHYIHNKSLTELINYFYYNYENVISVSNETGYYGNVYLELTDNLNNFSDLKKKLNKQGLDISYQTRFVDFLVISDR